MHPQLNHTMHPSSCISMAPNNDYQRLTMAVKAHHPHLHIHNKSEDMATNSAPNTKAGSRKRPRDVLCELNSQYLNQGMLEINQLMLQHMEKFRIEMVELSRQKINRIFMGIGNEISEKLKRKDEDMERIAQANRSLEDRISNLAMEAHLWRNLAQSNEAAANMLRANLDEVLANRREFEEKADQHIDEAAESCCSGGEKEEQKEFRASLCMYCREKVASVLLLPCQHLCLCDSCGLDPMVVICPACGADRTGVFKVNLV